MNYILFEKIYFSRLIKESLKLILIKNNLKKLSKSNELKDYRNLLRKKDLRLNNELLDEIATNTKYVWDNIQKYNKASISRVSSNFNLNKMVINYENVLNNIKGC